jgi:hypothetical protein
VKIPNYEVSFILQFPPSLFYFTSFTFIRVRGQVPNAYKTVLKGILYFTLIFVFKTGDGKHYITFPAITD